ncbi:MAG: histidine--tRNA ligase [Bacteroidetes bacterium]|nr:histidine--tRNA ligase [Bacteroidota bacterium]
MIKAIKGTKDLLPSDVPRWHYLEDIVKKIFTNFNYKEIRTPIFELTSLFARSIGEETDIVGKEMYTFEDMSGASITLKPEMTAGVVRAFIEHSLGAQQQLTKLYYISPMFRQEKPQAGRLRQFHQFGGEAIGSASPILDAEMIQIAFDILKSLGLKDLTVKINSLGTTETRENFKNLLREFLNDKKDKLSEDSKKRFDNNILRIFDSKIEIDQKLLADAPALIDQLDDESKNDFDLVKEYLTKINIPFEIDPHLVRGLDYYSKTTFEIISGKVGAQDALLGGGRYDLLAEQLGGKPTPAVGFAAGIERILLACENENSFKVDELSIDIYLIRIDKELELKVSELASELRRKGLRVEYDYLQRSVKAQMREANKFNARFALFIGGGEYEEGKMNLKDMKTSEQKLIPIDNISEVIDNIKI